MLYNAQQGSFYIDNIQLIAESESLPPNPLPEGSPGAGIVYGCGNAFCVDDCTFYYQERIFII